MNEYQKLLVLEVAIRNLEGIEIPYSIIKNHIKPLMEWVDKRILELEKEKKY